MTNSYIRLHKVVQNNILTHAAEAASVLECLYNFSGCQAHVSAELAPRAVSRVMAPTKSVYRASYQYVLLTYLDKVWTVVAQRLVGVGYSSQHVLV